MARLIIFFSLLVAGVIVGLAPLALLFVWHFLALLVSAGMFFFLIEEYGDLDSGLVALAILAMGLAGILLGKLSGLGWSSTLLLALPSFSMTIALLVKGNKA